MEKTCLFGEQNNLLGILSEPDRCVADKNSPIVLILNSGLVHHTGPFRMSVDIARLLASKGFRN